MLMRVLIIGLLAAMPWTAYAASVGGAGGVVETLDQAFDAGAEIDGATSANPLRVGNGTNHWALYNDVTDGLQLMCVIAGIPNDCNYIRKLATGKFFEIINNASTSIFRVSESGAITNATLDAEATGNVLTRPFYWDLDLCAINPADASLSHVWNKDPLSASPTLTAKAGTNRSTCVATFPDSDGDYGVAISRRLPTGFTGSFDAEIWWDASGTGNVVWQVATKCYAHDEADDAAYNTASTTTVAPSTAGRLYRVQLGVTTTGCAGGEMMRIRLFRNRTHASDSINSAVNIEKVTFIGRATK